ncbi:2-polyprenyl-6-methoxyphenol hydroxylase-like FAD-dependent oxidoreductase [Streptomyces sp. PvR018]
MFSTTALGNGCDPTDDTARSTASEWSTSTTRRLLIADGFASTYRRVMATGRRSRRIPSCNRFVAYGRNGSHNSSHCATGNSALMR